MCSSMDERGGGQSQGYSKGVCAVHNRGRCFGPSTQRGGETVACEEKVVCIESIRIRKDSLSFVRDNRRHCITARYYYV